MDKMYKQGPNVEGGLLFTWTKFYINGQQSQVNNPNMDPNKDPIII